MGEDAAVALQLSELRERVAQELRSGMQMATEIREMQELRSELQSGYASSAAPPAVAAGMQEPQSSIDEVVHSVHSLQQCVRHSAQNTQKSLKRSPSSRSIGFCSQKDLLSMQLSVEEQICLYARLCSPELDGVLNHGSSAEIKV